MLAKAITGNSNKKLQYMIWTEIKNFGQGKIQKTNYRYT